MKQSLSETIRLIRESKGFSQDYVAQKMKITQQAYSQMEKKPENMTLGRLKKLAGVFDVSILTLIGEDNPYYQSNFNQQGGQAATQMVFHQESMDTNTLYERLIEQLKQEISFLRSNLKSS
jgi:transcriptional regulator with XRE-family HTH domain